MEKTMTKRGIVKIKNIKTPANETCECGNWLNHWNNFNDKPPVFCSEIRCTDMFHLIGAHVQKVGEDEDWYIVPLCTEHSKVKGELVINNFVKLVSANIEDTCG